MDFSRIAAIIMSFITLVFSLVSITTGNKTLPVFEDRETRIKTKFDEGEFSMKSVDITVSPNGNDKNSGTVKEPLKTIEAAKEKLKSLKNFGCGHVTVWFREGTYSVANTVSFTADDLTDVTYRSYPGEKVVFSGAKEISGWKETTVNGVTALVTDYSGEYFNVMYNGETRLSRSVFPKVGELSVEKALSSDAFCPDTEYFNLHAAFYGNTGDLLSFKNINDVDVRILHYWNDELLPVSSINLETCRIEVQKPASMTINAGDRYYFENVFEALSEPGEWYLDRSDSKLYYIPFDGQTADNTVLKAGIEEKIITVDSCNNIDFQGIEFSETAWNIYSGEHFVNFISESSNPLISNIKYLPNFPQACYDSPCAVTLTNCNDVNFTDCSFKLIGSSALQFGNGTKNCSAKASMFDNIGGNAVYIKGVNDANSTYVTSDITVTDCHIKSYGRVFNNAIGILLVHAFDCEISQNEIHDGFYTAISSGWVWGYGTNITDNIRITKNLIYDIGKGWLSDMGGIYTLGIQPHSVITGNVVRDVGCYEGESGYGGWGIYLDEGTSYMLVENNLVYNCSSQGFHQHYGENNMIRNNIFALNGEGQLRVSKKEDHNSLYLYNNIFVGDNTQMYYESTGGKFIDKDNVYWDYSRGKRVFSGTGVSLSERKSVNDMEKLGYYNEAVFVDPVFRDSQNGDFTLASDSPAIKAGFIPFKTDNAGTLTLLDF